MPHVDDALLVAFADDALPPGERAQVEAHLASCDECRARVEEERALAQRAAAVLGLGALPEGAAAPPFAEIVRRSEGGAAPVAAKPQGTRRTLPPLAWAAMLIVALGAGWIARVLLVSPDFNAPVERARSEASADEDAARASAGREAVVGEERDPEEAGDAAQLQRVAPSSAESDAAPAPGAPVTQRFEAAVPREATERAAAAAPAPPAAPPAAASDSPAQLQTLAARAAPDSVARRALDASVSSVSAAEAEKAAPGTGVVTGRVVDARTNEPLAGSQVAVAGTALGTITDAQGGFRIRGVPMGVRTLRVRLIGYDQDSQRVAVAADSSVSAEIALSSAALALEAVVVAGAGAGAVDIDSASAAWRGTSLAQAGARGVQPIGIAGAPVELVWFAAADAPWRARVVQRIDGAAVEIVEWRALALEVAGTSGTLDDGRSYLFTRSGHAPVLLRSTLPLARLRGLATQLEPLP